jgi:hypothetical protein
MAEPWMDVTQVMPNEHELVATVQTGTHVMNTIEGDRIRDERWFKITCRPNEAGALLVPVAISEIPKPPDPGPPIRDAQGVEVDTGPRVQTPPPIARTGYSAADKAGTDYLCEKPGRIDDNDGPWAVMTSEGQVKAEIQSIDAKSLGGFVRHDWNAATAQVAFRSSQNFVSPPNTEWRGWQLNTLAVKVWSYGGGQSSVRSYVLDLSKAFNLKGRTFVPNPALTPDPASITRAGR